MKQFIYWGLCYCIGLLSVRVARIEMDCICASSWSHGQKCIMDTPFPAKKLTDIFLLHFKECFDMTKGHLIAFLCNFYWKTAKLLWQSPFKNTTWCTRFPVSYVTKISKQFQNTKEIPMTKPLQQMKILSEKYVLFVTRA